MSRTWFKHFGNAHEGSLANLIANKDYESVALYWIILECLCRFEDPKKPGELRISKHLISKKMNMSWVKLQRKLGQLALNMQMHFESTLDPLWVIQIDKFAELNNWGGSRSRQDLLKTPVEDRRKKKEDRYIERSSEIRVAPQFVDISSILLSRKITEGVQTSWLDAYGDSAWIKSEIKKAIAWEESDPSRRKKNFAKFITNWLGRAERPKKSPVLREYVMGPNGELILKNL
jgi:hypothetical protein